VIPFGAGDQDAYLNQPHFEIRPTIELQDLRTGEIVDITDRLVESEGFEIANSQDDACGTATLTFERDAGVGGPLSPLNASAVMFPPAVLLGQLADARGRFDPG
jgi:hypothetical protein